MKTITVTGTGIVSAAPDNIILSMTLNARDAAYEKTMELAADGLEELRAALSGCGFGAEDIKTVSFNVNTEYRHDHKPSGEYERVFVGYNCIHQLRLEFDLDMEKLSAVLAGVSGCKCAPEFSISFGVKDEDALRAELLRSAAASAKAKAEILAEASDAVVGELINIDYSLKNAPLRSDTNFAMPMAEERMLAKASMDIVPEDVKASDVVTFVWEIK